MPLNERRDWIDRDGGARQWREAGQPQRQLRPPGQRPTPASGYANNADAVRRAVEAAGVEFTNGRREASKARLAGLLRTACDAQRGYRPEKLSDPATQRPELLTFFATTAQRKRGPTA